jgi:hypothetical protein
MFNLTLHDHLQLTFNEIIQRHQAHAAKAQLRARWSRRLKGAEAFLIGGVGLAAAGAALGRGQALAAVAAALACIALIILLVDLSFNLDASARAHAACSAQLWGLRDRYRSLLSDLHDGALNLADARQRRDRMLDELRSIYETTSVIALEHDVTPPSAAAEEAGTAARPRTGLEKVG